MARSTPHENASSSENIAKRPRQRKCPIFEDYRRRECYRCLQDLAMALLCCAPGGLGGAIEPTSSFAYLSHLAEFEKVCMVSYNKEFPA
jgi:hypothetical protein